MNVVFVLYILGSSVSPLLHKQTLGPIFNETSYSICLHSLLLHDSTNKRQYEFGCLFVTLYINQVTLHYFCSIFLFQAQKVKSKSVHNLLTYVGQLSNSLFFLFHIVLSQISRKTPAIITWLVFLALLFLPISLTYFIRLLGSGIENRRILSCPWQKQEVFLFFTA